MCPNRVVFGTRMNRPVKDRRQRTEYERALLCANADLARARDAAVAASHAKTTLLETVSHEIRTPMTGILGLAEVLIETELDQRQKQMVGVIHSSAEKLVELVNELLDLSRIEAGKEQFRLTRFEPVGLTQGVIGLFAQSAERAGVRIESEIDLAPGLVLVGPARLFRQVLVNLLSNALKFAPQGVVTLRMHLRRAGGDQVLAFEVADTGPGIPEDLKHAVFDRFSKADEHSAGSGLGLSIARQHCEMAGGTLTLKDTAGGGATFCGYMIVERRLSKDAAPGDSGRAAGKDARKLRLLVAEDNMSNRMVVEEMFYVCGAECAFADHGANALALLEKDRFDGALIDIQMPVMGGLEFVKTYRDRETGPDRLPIVAYSANVMEHQVQHYLYAGFDRHLRKPSGLDEVRGCLDWIRSRVSANPRGKGSVA